MLQRLKGDRQESRLWGFVITKSMRRPALAAGLSTAILVVLALPALAMHTKQAGFTDLPKNLSIVKTLRHDPGVLPRLAGARPPGRQVRRRDDTTVREGLCRVQTARARDRGDPRADPGLRQRRQDGRADRLPARRQGQRRNRGTRPRDAAHAGDPAGAGDATAGHRGRCDRHDTRRRRLQPDHEARARRSCSRSCSGWPSSCCCSPSARS